MPATKLQTVSENAALATRPIAKHTAPTTKHAPVSQLHCPWNPAANTNRKLSRGHSQSAVLKKGPEQTKLSRARQLLAKAAVVLELRLPKRRSLTRQGQGDIHRIGALPAKARFALKNAFGTRLPQITRGAS